MDDSTLVLTHTGKSIATGISELRKAKPSKVCIDLTEAKWLRTLDLARIRCAIDLVINLGVSLSILHPRTKSVQNYAGRMGLFEGTGYEYPFQRRSSDSFFPLRRITNDQNEDLFDLSSRIFGERIPGNYVRRVSDAFCELADNVYFHSGEDVNSGWGYVVAQTVGATAGIAIVDFGVGFYGSYERQSTLRARTELQILEDSFNVGESSLNPSFQGGHRGIGLADVLEFVHGTDQGTLEVRSGRARAVARAGKLAVGVPLYRVAGTWIHMEVPLP